METLQSMELPNTPDQLLKQSNTNWNDVLTNSTNWHKIPLLNYSSLHNLKDQSLVRFRGMVQDMMDPEIYLERYEVKLSNGGTRLQDGKYRDCLSLRPGEELNYDAQSNVHGERRTLFVVSVPGLNDWTKDYEKQCNPQVRISTTEQLGNNATKRVIDDTTEMEVEVDGLSITNGSTSKRQCVAQPQDKASDSNATATRLGPEYLINSPLPSRPSMACMVKVYENFETYTLNTLVDFVGFLSVDPALDASTLDTAAMNHGDFDNISEMQAQNPPPSLIPRLHAFGYKLLPHANPLLDKSFFQSQCIDIQNLKQSQETIHKNLLMVLKLCLFDDHLAADYLLSHLISTVYSRSDMECIGKFTLNICNLPKAGLQQYTTKLYEVLELLLPASHYLPMTLDTMNSEAFVPKKDYVTNKLVSGMLQLAPHTHLVIDETRLQEGKLEASGVQAVQHLAHLINQQQLKCDFQYYQIDYNANIPVLVLSEGRSMLPNDFVLPISADNKSMDIIEESFKAAMHYLQPDRLQQFRSYLTLARLSQFEMGENHTEMIQKDFVEMRKANSKSNADDLHGLLILSRLLGIARGNETFDKETWELAKEMERMRRLRLQGLPKSTHQMRI